MTGIICALAGGKGAYSSTTVTVGTFSSSGFTYYGFSGTLFGSVNPATFSPLAYPFTNLYWVTDGTSFTGLRLEVTGNHPNSGWETMNIGGVVYNRTSFTYSYSSTTNRTEWQGSALGTNPFGTTVGATKAVVWF